MPPSELLNDLFYYKDFVLIITTQNFYRASFEKNGSSLDLKIFKKDTPAIVMGDKVQYDSLKGLLFILT